jgi:transposase-like protein
MTKARFSEEFKEEAVKQVIERGYTVPDVAKRLGVSAHQNGRRTSAMNGHSELRAGNRFML